MSSEAKCNCQHCSGHIAFPVEMAGQTILCPHCGQKTTLNWAGFSGLKLSLALAFTLGCILGSFAIFNYRVEKLTKDMVGPVRADFTVKHIPKHLQKANRVEELEKDVAEIRKRTLEEYNSVSARETLNKAKFSNFSLG